MIQGQLSSSTLGTKKIPPTQSAHVQLMEIDRMIRRAALDTADQWAPNYSARPQLNIIYQQPIDKLIGE